MTIMSLPIWQDRNTKLNIRFPPYFLILVGLLKFVLSVLTQYFGAGSHVYHVVNVVVTASLVVAAATIPIPKTTLYKSGQITVKLFRSCSYVASFILALFAYIATFAQNNTTADTLLIIALVLCIFEGHSSLSFVHSSRCCDPVVGHYDLEMDTTWQVKLVH
jgi:hypothetical protein